MRPNDLGIAYIRRHMAPGRIDMTVSDDDLKKRLRFRRNGHEPAEVLIVIGQDQKWSGDFRRWNDAS
jgi:hypothetical protein